MARQLADQIILVTGATGSIGFEIAAQAAESGATVAVHGSRAERVDDAIARLLARVPDARLIAAQADFRTVDGIERMVDAVVRETGRLDSLVHCAVAGAPGVVGVFADTDPTAFVEHAGLVIGSFQRLCAAALPHLAREGGTIIGFASDAGRFAAARQSLVGAAFGGVMTFVRNLAMESARDRIRVHCVSPSFVEGTRAFQAHAGRAATAASRAGLGLPTPADIAPTVLFLCGPAATKITGQVISINGGLNV
ncbi:SDR family oxidoreductase [Nocardia sp. NBC_01377]|uniref:SDR family NAD(P)-dependent oxidoreductase n=1 Tax=Nocardia sp. NBC_01377 TaxID=2903595 RepID=UPI0032473594